MRLFPFESHESVELDEAQSTVDDTITEYPDIQIPMTQVSFYKGHGLGSAISATNHPHPVSVAHYSSSMHC